MEKCSGKCGRFITDTPHIRIVNKEFNKEFYCGNCSKRNAFVVAFGVEMKPEIQCTTCSDYFNCYQMDIVNKKICHQCGIAESAKWLVEEKQKIVDQHLAVERWLLGA